MSAEAAFQAAVLARLAADAQVKARFGDPARIYDRAPGGATFPFLAAGRGESEPADADGADLIVHRLTLHVWARRDDMEELKSALGAVRAALHGADIALPAPYHALSVRIVYADMFRGPDGRTLRGLARVRGLIGINAL